MAITTYINTEFSSKDIIAWLRTSEHVSLIQEKPERAVWWVEMEEHAKQNFSKSVIHFSRDHPPYAEIAKYAAEQRDMFDNDEEAIACFCGD
jgi:hypothetical protein